MNIGEPTVTVGTDPSIGTPFISVHSSPAPTPSSYVETELRRQGMLLDLIYARLTRPPLWRRLLTSLIRGVKSCFGH